MIAVDALTAEEQEFHLREQYRRGLMDEVLDRREEAEEQHGRKVYPAAIWLSLLTEEVGEVATAVNVLTFAEALDIDQILSLRSELMDVAQVALAAIEQIDSQLVVEEAEE